jgi:predicted RNase H-like HicB family nuclease
VKTYKANVRKDGRWWFVHIPELDTAGQARTLAEADEVAREVIGLYLDIPPMSFNVEVTVGLPEQAADLWAQATATEQDARAKASRAARLRREALQVIKQAGISQADAARALHLSPQRVSQLVR